MAKDFKKLAAEQKQARVAVPQVDPERPLEPAPLKAEAAPVEAPESAPLPAESKPELTGPHITTVNTSERPVNKSFSMYPSRHEQIVRDLAYIERRHPWQIIEDMAEEYVTKYYGKEHKRK